MKVQSPTRLWIVALLSTCAIIATAFAGLDCLILDSVVDLGGERSTSLDYVIEGSFGQDIADPSVVSSSDYVVYAGFFGQQVNLAPQASGAEIQLGADGTALLSLTSLFSDPDYDPLSLSVSAPGGGSVVVSGTSVLYSAGAGFAGSDSFQYSVSDGALVSSAFVSIVDKIAPTISGIFSDLTVTASTLGVALVPNYLAQAAVSDNSGVIASAVQSPPSGSVVGAGSFNVVLTAKDAAGNSTSRTLSAVVRVPVAISAQPSSAASIVGGSVTFSVSVTGSAPLTYQWRKDGVNISGGTLETFTISAARASDAGSYDVLVTNGVGSVISSAATFVVGDVPTFTFQPVSVTVAQGGSATFSVGVSGQAPFSYQWRKGGSAIYGGTSSTYAIASVQMSDAGSYDVLVTNVVGTVSSGSATLSVMDLPFITAQPESLSVVLGGSATFSVNASGQGPFTYQWRKGGVNMAGAILPRFSIAAAVKTDADVYDVIITGPSGRVTSQEASLVVLTPPVLGSPSATQLAMDGSGSLIAQVQSETAYTYYWKRNGSLIPSPTLGGLELFSGITGSGTGGSSGPVALNFSNANDLSEGTYSLVVANAFGGVESGSASVSVNFSRPKALEFRLTKSNVISDLRANGNGSVVIPLSPAANDSIVVNARGPAGMTYVWTFTSGTLAGGISAKLKSTSATLSFADEVPKPPGVYQCTLNAPDGGGYGSVKFLVSALGAVAAIPGAGTYEGLLEASGTPVGDGAKFRGIVSFTFTGKGAVSGVIRYNEAGSLSGGSSGLRVYRPMKQAFTGSLQAVPGTSASYVCSPVLGTGSLAAGRDLTLELDCATSPIKAGAIFRDRLSWSAAVSGQGSESRVQRLAKVLTNLPAGCEGAAGRSLVQSNFEGEDAIRDKMYSLVQVTPQGMATWMNRLPGYTATGSTSLSVVSGSELEAQLYDAPPASRVGSSYAVNSLISRLRVSQGADGNWKAAIGNDSVDQSVERHSAFLLLTKASTLPPVFSATGFAAGTNWTGISAISFSDGDGRRWIQPGKTALPADMPVETPVRLRLQDPVPDSAGRSVSYAWNITIPKAGGACRCAPITELGVTPPTLTMTLDAVTGQWVGAFTPVGKARRVVSGVATGSDLRVLECSRGWVEVSGEQPVMHVGAWRLERGQ